MTTRSSSDAPASKKDGKDTSQQVDEATLRQSARRSFVWWFFQNAVWLFTVVWFRLKARGLENIPEIGGGLILSNHQSYLDIPALGCPVFRPISFLARESLMRIPGLGLLLRHTHVVPIDRKTGGSTSFRKMVEAMQQGFLVGVFPEGTRSADGKLLPFKAGFASILRRSRMPIFPVGIAGSAKALPRGAFLMRPRTIRVVWGPPISAEEYEPLLARGKEEELVELVRSRISQAMEEADAWRSGNSPENQPMTHTDSQTL